MISFFRCDGVHDSGETDQVQDLDGQTRHAQGVHGVREGGREGEMERGSSLLVGAASRPHVHLYCETGPVPIGGPEH